ncbi:MAG: hypothetical protein M3Q07_24115, partial [Pseudobdellovibrionaceae bacterium]|nr:hypothetical protein [Pseudobdellovibrionaceae bacterium]
LEAHRQATDHPALAQKLLTQALFMNAFADHFLTDGFASGHVRAPRVQIMNWAQTANLSDRAAGTLAKIVHDRDGEVRVSGEHGLHVTNTRGDTWLTRCDSQLFWNNTLQDPAIQIPMQAVAASVKEVFQAYEYGVVVPGVYAATEWVPFPSADERDLIEHFPRTMTDADYDKIMKQMAFYTQIKALSGVDKGVLKQFTAALPQLMEDFRTDVQQDILNHPILSQRLPAAYLNAYQSIK